MRKQFRPQVADDAQARVIQVIGAQESANSDNQEEDWENAGYRETELIGIPLEPLRTMPKSFSDPIVIPAPVQRPAIPPMTRANRTRCL